MARNASIVLTDSQKDVARQVRESLAGIQYGDKVEIGFVKRDHSTSRIVGSVVNVVGKDDKEAVVLLTDKGHRSANLWAVTDLRVVR